MDRYAPVIFSTVQRVVRARARDDPSVSVEDIVQDVFLRLFKKDARLLRSYDPTRASLATWLAIIARSTTLDVLRKKKLPTVPLAAAEQAPAPGERPKASPATAGVPPDLLSPRQELVMQLIYDRGLEVKEIARILGIEEQTVRSAKHKALTKLRAFFDKRAEKKAGMFPGSGS